MATLLPTPAFRLEDGLARVERVLGERVACDEPLLERMARDVLFAGGKRLRPRVALLAYAACGGGPDAPDALVDAAAAIELIHTASLVHDDIIDASPLRRGRATLHTTHGLGHGIVAGDFLFTQGFALSARLDAALVAITAEACTRLAEGEVLEQRLAGRPDVDVDAYLRVIAKKTAEPLRACGRVGAHLAAAPPTIVEAMGRYGLELGLAFQIADDLLDVVGDPRLTGKPVGLDKQAGVATLPDFLAARGGDPIAEARRFATRFVADAKRAIEGVPASDAKAELVALADTVVSRVA
jgi:geranylgeranyl pyrophosphate synthase